jgi:hypothetical protein
MNSRLEDLDFVDDICLMSHRESDMENKLNKLIRYAKQVGLKVNKTNIMQFNTKTQIGSSVSIDNENAEKVINFCYLASIIA